MKNQTLALKYLGAISGGIGLTLITTLYHGLFFTRVLNDGQYGIVWMFTLPAGAVLGWAAKQSMNIEKSPVKRVLSCLVGCFLVSIPVILYLWQTTSNSQLVSNQPVTDALTEGILFALPTIICIFALALWGILLALWEILLSRSQTKD